MICAALLCLQLVNAPNAEQEAYERRITPDVRVVLKVAPTVVYITTTGLQHMRDFSSGRIVSKKRDGGSGSGVVIHEEGYIVTNYHVVKDANEAGENGTIQVTFDPTYGDKTVYSAELISAEPLEDLALLKIERKEAFAPIVLGTSRDLMIAERVLAFGNPYGHTHTVSRGIISGLHRQVTVSQTQQFSELIQTDAAINPGNSGGPLVNINGELIGINTVMNVQAQNIGFAIPVDEIHRVLREKLLSPSIARAWLGFDVDLKTLLVENVLPGSPADQAGLLKGDSIRQIGDKQISNEEEYRFARLELSSDQTIAIEVGRAGESQQLSMHSWNRIHGLFFKRIGLLVEDSIINFGYNQNYCLRIAELRKGGPAEQLGLKVGDIITTVTPIKQRSVTIRSKADLALLINRLDPETLIEIDLWRDVNENQVFERTNSYSELFQGSLALQ
ncbi:MAG: serine protease Do [Planctomycetota bacterium]|jgi:serine protease Do